MVPELELTIRRIHLHRDAIVWPHAPTSISLRYCQLPTGIDAFDDPSMRNRIIKRAKIPFTKKRVVAILPYSSPISPNQSHGAEVTLRTPSLRIRIYSRNYALSISTSLADMDIDGVELYVVGLAHYIGVQE